jgi:SAM-dependent methyltransferase
MLRYFAAAQALRLASANGTSKKMYRRLANHLGGRARGKGLPHHYIQRAHDNLARIEARDGIADGMTVMELGTGWTHWEALFTRLFYDVEVILFDVWDNRQFGGFIAYAAELKQRLRRDVPRPGHAIDRAERILEKVLAAPDFDAVYALLNFRYLVQSDGSLAALADRSLDLIVSSDVLEHVSASAVPGLIDEMHRVLKSGGISAHRIAPFDHLKIYDPSVHDKHYLQYSDEKWNAWFANDVQYQNRIQHSEWLSLMEAGGFQVETAETLVGQPLNGLAIAPRFAHLPATDWVAINSYIVARATA